MTTGVTFYKYRSLDNWRFVLDIFLNKRFYAAPFASLNDPMEGQYYYVGNRVAGNVRAAISAQTNQWNICSLTRDPKQSLMWAYYTGGHRGIVIGVKIDARRQRTSVLRKVDYDSRVYVRPDEAKGTADDLALTILFRKQFLWGHEAEWRVVTLHQFVPIKIEEVYLGALISESDGHLITKLVTTTAPQASVRKIRRSSLR
jgi:hypothetical protein